MCYLVRQQQAQAESGVTSRPPSLERLRPRVIGAVGAALVAGLAWAALSVPPAEPPVLKTKDTAAAVPVVITSAPLPAATMVKQGMVLPQDDGVPTASDVAKASAGDCHHGL